MRYAAAMVAASLLVGCQRESRPYREPNFASMPLAPVCGSVIREEFSSLQGPSSATSTIPSWEAEKGDTLAVYYSLDQVHWVVASSEGEFSYAFDGKELTVKANQKAMYFWFSAALIHDC